MEKMKNLHRSIKILILAVGVCVSGLLPVGAVALANKLFDKGVHWPAEYGDSLMIPTIIVSMCLGVFVLHTLEKKMEVSSSVN